MTYLKNIAAAVCIATLALDLPLKTEGNPYVISDDRVRNLDVTPVLGRGYSIMTNSFQSTCLNVEEITIPSFNYDYSFHEFTSSTDIMEDLGSALSVSFAYGSVKAEFEETYDSTTTSTSSTHYILASMRIERYYASVKDEASSISPEASFLLENQDYIGFFKACGPNYVRSIRRAQEVVAMFKFETSSVAQAEAFAQSLQVAGQESADGTVQVNTDTGSVSKSLTIKITGYGLGLMEGGSDTLMATTLEQFNGVMSYAYNTMTKNPNAHHIGMVYGIEVVPWAENVLFQVAANIASTDVEIPVERSLIPRAYNKTDITDYEFDSTDALEREEFKCKSLGHVIDMYGYCCEAASLYDFVNQEYNADNVVSRACRPIRSLSKVFVKENLAGNGEFVARLDRALRYKTNTLATLQKCISSIRGYPGTLDKNYLIPHADPLSSDVAKITVLDMKTAMDPFNDYSMVKHMGREIDEFISMYYAPCLNALFGGTGGETDPNYFMAYPWYTHTECGYMSCLASGMRWDRENGGCVPGLMSGPSSADYPASDANAKCAYDTEAGGNAQTCKYTATDLNEFQTNMKNCWNNPTLQAGFSVDMFLTNYCMPKVSSKTMPAAEFAALKASIPTNCGGTSGDAALSDPAPTRYRSAAAKAKAFEAQQDKLRR